LPNSHRIAEQCGIILHGRRGKRHPRTDELPERHTWSRRAILEAARHGEGVNLPDHVFDVLGLIISTPHNSTQLFGDTISGVSKWALRNRITTEEVTFLRPAFDQVDLKLIRSTVSHHKIDVRPPQIGFLVAAEMEEALQELRT